MSGSIVTLLSDFGLKDPYVAEMKAVILAICPNARIIDISHLIEKFNVKIGAFVLASAARYFADGAIHVAVVDPGVGTKRRALLAQTKRAFYIGPDNGILMLAAKQDPINHVFTLTNPEFMLPKISSTFHGRDVFAPAAAHLANGVKPERFGPEISDFTVPSFAQPVLQAKGLAGEVLYIDDFGNVVTNITGADLRKAGIKVGERLVIRLKNKSYHANLSTAYGEGAPRSLLALIGSHGLIEIAVNQGSASEKLRVKVGDAMNIGENGDS
ncbi:MAG TPA: SAM-dependent chlorinase/fluorinase [Candidatus Bathyarchaeia archaeon]|nr:SAM-dependent chlorinase/fluorinase [Candidatus Bathyarchaeia archaeon]